MRRTGEYGYHELDMARKITRGLRDRMRSSPPRPKELTADPVFGMWKNRDDLRNVPAVIRKWRTSRLEKSR